jgi:hypothetical protein
MKRYARLNVGHWPKDEQLGLDPAGSGGEPPRGSGTMAALIGEVANRL